MRFLSIIILLLLLAPSLFAQQQKKTIQKKTHSKQTVPKTQTAPQRQNMPKQLTATQKKQMEAYKKINELIKQKKVDEILFFKSLYGPIQEHCQTMANKNMAAVERNEANADKANEQGDTKRMETFEAVAKLYRNAATTIEKLDKAISETKRSQTRELVAEYIKIENELRSLRFKPVAREWFSQEEILNAIYSPQKNNRP